MQPNDNVGTRKDMAFHRLQIAKEDLETAQLLLREGKFRAANNRAYYSIYHAIDTVLYLEGTAFKRHKDTLAYFNKNYVATNIFPRMLGRQIVKAEEIRHNSDYDPFYIASKEVTASRIETSNQLIERVEEYYRKHTEHEAPSFF